MQEREDTTELLILPHYSRQGQSISFIKKGLILLALSWFILFIPTDLQGTKNLMNAFCIWVHMWNAIVRDMDRAPLWAQFQTRSHFLSHCEESRQSEGGPRRNSLLGLEAEIKTGITKDALQSEDVTQASHPNLSPGFDGIDTLDDPSVCSAPLPIVGSREQEGSN